MKLPTLQPTVFKITSIVAKKITKDSFTLKKQLPGRLGSPSNLKPGNGVFAVWAGF